MSWLHIACDLRKQGGLHLLNFGFKGSLRIPNIAFQVFNPDLRSDVKSYFFFQHMISRVMGSVFVLVIIGT